MRPPGDLTRNCHPFVQQTRPVLKRRARDSFRRYFGHREDEGEWPLEPRTCPEV